MKNTITRNNISLTRGYCGHEHWSQFGLIDMNGRFYDPLLGRFLSPDPYVQAPENPQNLNRYSYCLNNPLKYTDPSGELIFETFLFKMFSSAIVNVFLTEASGGNFWRGAAVGAISGSISFASKLIPLGGIISRGITMSGISIGINGISNKIYGNNFFAQWQAAAITGFLSGALEGGLMAHESGRNMWWGNKIADNRGKWSFFNSDRADNILWFGISSNVGGKRGMDCIPSSFAETERYHGGTRTYEDFCSMVGYINNEGTELSVSQFNELVLNNFSNSSVFPAEYENKLFDPDYLAESINKKEAYMFLFKDGIDSRHADVLRGLKVFEKSPQKNELLFRESKFNYKLFGSERPLSIIKICMP